MGTVHKVCANPACPIHHPKHQVGKTANDAQFKAEQEKRRREEAIANVTGLRVLTAIGAAVPVRLVKRDLLFVVERLASLLDESRLAMLARQHGIRQKRDDGGIAKTLGSYFRRADENTLGRAVVESSILLAASRGNASQVLREAATAYKVDIDATAAKVKQEFSAKDRAKTAKPTGSKQPSKGQAKAAKRAAA